MKRSQISHCSSLAVACAALTACGSNNSNSSSSPAPESKAPQVATYPTERPQSPNESEKPLASETPPIAESLVNPESQAIQVAESEFEIPQVKYPAAVIFEGGKGEPWFDATGAKHIPQLRLYLCLKKSTNPIQEQVTVDLANLGSPIEISARNGSTNQLLWTERLTNLILNYTYTAELSDDPDHNNGYAYGKASFESSSIQNWLLVYLSPGATKGPHQSFLDLSLFNFRTTYGTIVSQNQYVYTFNNENYYVSSKLDRFTFSRKEKQVHVIDACEKQDKPYFFQIGDETA